MSYSIAVIVGSYRQDSYNQKLAKTVIEQAPSNLDCQLISIADLPMYNQDLDDQLPTSVQNFKQSIKECHAALFITPEYNRSIPGILKNAIDWASRPPGQNSWSGKPVGIMGASNGQFGTIHAQYDLRKILTHTECLIMPQPQFLISQVQDKIIEGGFEPDTQKRIKKYLQALSDWIAHVS